MVAGGLFGFHPTGSIGTAGRRGATSAQLVGGATRRQMDRTSLRRRAVTKGFRSLTMIAISARATTISEYVVPAERQARRSDRSSRRAVAATSISPAQKRARALLSPDAPTVTRTSG